MSEGVVEKGWPLVPDAEYCARMLHYDCCELISFKRAPKLFLHLKIIDPGPHFGKVLYRAYNVREIHRRAGRVGDPIRNGQFVLGRRSDLLKDVCRLLDLRVRPDRVSLRSLKPFVLRIKTRTVEKDCDRIDLPVALMYSVVDQIVGKETGQ
jgi:hypothetical protein